MTRHLFTYATISLEGNETQVRFVDPLNPKTSHSTCVHPKKNNTSSWKKKNRMRKRERYKENLINSLKSK
jgi:hypothetical protein